MSMQVDELLDCCYTERKKSQHDVRLDFSKYIDGKKTLDSILSQPYSGGKKNAVYIHIPYCKKICSFCNMRRAVSAAPEDYAGAVIKQIQHYGKTEYVKTTPISSVYFGGGTPTALPAEQLAAILQALYENFRIAENAEVSMETTVSELDEHKMKVLLENKLNRFSIGIQTFNDEGRKTLGRIGSGENAANVIKQAFKTGFKNVNIDIIYNYPDETESILREDLKTAFALDIAGFSFYSLIVGKDSKIARTVDPKTFAQETLRRDASFFIAALDESRKAGYEFLEITKLVKPGRDNYEYIRCGHLGGDVFPVGAGAGGSVNGTSFMNPLEKDKFIGQVGDFSQMSGMSMKPDYKHIKCFSGQMQEGSIDFSFLTEEEKEKALKIVPALEANELIKKSNTFDGYCFTDKGFFWGNSLAADLVEKVFSA